MLHILSETIVSILAAPDIDDFVNLILWLCLKKKQQSKQSEGNNKRKKSAKNEDQLELSNCNLAIVSWHGLFFEASFRF